MFAQDPWTDADQKFENPHIIVVGSSVRLFVYPITLVQNGTY